MTAGAQRSWSGIGWVESEIGDGITVNPEEIHDGAPIAGARGWRMLYFNRSLIAAALTPESAERLEIVRPVLRDPVFVDRFTCLFAGLTDDEAGPLGVEEDLLRLLVYLAQRYGAHPQRMSRASAIIGIARQRLDDAPATPTTLAELAVLCGLSRFQLLRGFARETGVTPHAYLLQRRVRLARRYLMIGSSIADAALQAGFADQSHLTRAFRRQFGITPARYCASLI